MKEKNEVERAAHLVGSALGRLRFSLPQDAEILPELQKLYRERKELLEALEWFVEFAAQHPEWMESFLEHEDSAEREWFDAARQAIAKAKGGV